MVELNQQTDMSSKAVSNHVLQQNSEALGTGDANGQTASQTKPDY